MRQHVVAVIEHEGAQSLVHIKFGQEARQVAECHRYDHQA
jgi:hypothetical protein